jgi:hypothetical protein
VNNEYNRQEAKDAKEDRLNLGYLGVLGGGNLN